MFSWPSLHERMCRTWGSNTGPLACQANSLPIELPRPVRLNSDNEFFVRRDIGMSVSERQKRYPCLVNVFYRCKMSRLMTKPTKWHVRPAKIPISLGIRPVWSESSLSAWRKRGSLATNRAHSQNSDQTGLMPRLIWVFAGCTVILLVLTWSGSNVDKTNYGWRHSMRCDNWVIRTTNIHK